MTDLSHTLPVLAIIVLVLGLIYLQCRLNRLEAGEKLRAQQQQLNVQMRRFAELTRRLLGGDEARAMSQEIAEAIASTSPFPQVTVAFVDGLQLNVAGSAGKTEKQAEDFRQALAGISMGQLQDLIAATAPNHQNSVVVSAEKGKELFQRDLETGDMIFVPMCSARKNPLGVFVLQGPEVAANSDKLIGVELLASHIAVTMENTSQKKRTFQSEKLEGMGQLVAGVAHELNNPLTAVLGYTEILAEKSDDPSVRYDLNVMRREALRMKRIIESLQQFSRKQRVERETVNLIAIIDDAVQARNDEIREQKIEVVKQVDPALPTIVANQSLIDQVFQHVFANAMEAVQKAGLRRILIEARAIGDQVHLQVSDSGAGFKDVSRVFDPFYTTKGPGKGTGLGLSLCYGIIRDHGGEITASNLHPLGACISIQLPLLSVEARSQTPSPAAPVIR